VLSGRDQSGQFSARRLASDEELVTEARAAISRLHTERHTEFNDLLE
jgi:hypothetical protein